MELVCVLGEEPWVGREGRLGGTSSHCALNSGVNAKDGDNPVFESSFPGHGGSIFIKVR